MATKKTYAAPTTGIVRTPKGVAKGLGVQYDPRTGQPTGFVRTSFAPGVGLAPGMGIKYVNGKPVAFQKAPPKGGYRARATPAAPAAPAQQSLREQSGYSESNLPPDAAYEQGRLAAERNRDAALAAITQQRTSGLSDYGFNADLTFDPNNPFSKAALLKKSYDQNRRASGQSMAAAGQQYAGAFQNQQDLINRGQLQSEDTLQKSLIRFLAQNTDRATQAQTGYETTESQLAAERVGRFQTNPLYDPTSPAPQPAAPAAARGAGLPQKTVGGRRFYQRASDKKWIPF